jgi:UDP-N-acetylglucosamine/UDP-N-acetylgalactosamine diphosphorylase
MSGGSSRKNHSEIGSSYIHFNFTPHQDKATPSLVGNVPKGVMLDQEPIFLGGQGGLVGPVRIAFGTVIPAGIICRQDIQQENTLYVAPLVESITTSRAFHVGAYRAIGRIVENNLVYIGNIQALKCWYEFVRKGRMSQDSFAAACYAGALQQLNVVINERVERLKELAGKMARSLEHAKRNTQLALPPELVRQQELLLSRWSELEFTLRQGPPTDAGIQERDRFLVAWEGLGPMPYLDAVRALPLDAKLAGTAWLKAVVESVSRLDRIVRE